MVDVKGDIRFPFLNFHLKRVHFGTHETTLTSVMDRSLLFFFSSLVGLSDLVLINRAIRFETG